MNKQDYNLTNWVGVLETDWDYFREDFGSANMENIIDRLLFLQKEKILKTIEWDDETDKVSINGCNINDEDDLNEAIEGLKRF